MEAGPLQSLNDTLARKGFPPVAPYQTSSSVPIDALHVDNVPRFKAASYMTSGLDRLSSRTADSLIFCAVPIADCAQMLEVVNNNRALGKAEIRSKIHRRRWSVDCSAYPEGKRSLSNDNDEYNPAFNYASVFKYTDAVKEVKAFAQGTHMDIQRLDVFNRNYTSAGKPSHTVLETANASINEAQFLHFLTLGPNDGWFHDSHIDISLDIVERAANCEKHGIAICRVGQGTELYTAAERKQGFPNEQETRFDSLLVEKCRDKDFILIPISNGFKDAHKIGLELERLGKAVKSNSIPEPKPLSQTAGHHWSLLLVDCRYSVIRGRYFDSSCHESAGSSHRAAVEESNNSKAAQAVLSAVRMMFNNAQSGRFDENEIVFNLDTHCPNQGYENVSGNKDGMGACGPFVFEMSKEITQYIVDCREDANLPNNDPDDPHLPVGYQRCRNWDSAKTRRAIRNLVLRELRTRKWLNGTSEWMNSLRGRDLRVGNVMAGWRSWLHAKGLSEMTFWDPWGLESELAPQYGQPVRVGS